MVETRIEPRYRVRKPATIEFRGDKVPCTIHDLSVTGAALQLSDLGAEMMPEDIENRSRSKGSPRSKAVGARH
jgi:PilZ domain